MRTPCVRHWGWTKTVLLGDSIVRDRKVEFVQRCASKRRVVCRTGKWVDWLVQEVANSRWEVVTMLLSSTLAPMTSGGWDRTNWFSVTNQWKKTDKVLVKSVLPRPWDGAAGVELVCTINRSLRTICERVGAKYVDLYPHFDGVPGIFMDGLHLKGWGAATLGRLLKNAVVNLCSSGPDVRLNSQPDRGARAPTLGIWLLGGWVAYACESVFCVRTAMRVQAGWLACSFESACVRTLQLSFY